MGMLGRLASSASLLLVLGCASPGEARSGSSRDELTRADLLDTHETTLYSAIQRLRPTWLRSRGTDLAGRTVAARVFVDGSPRGELDALRQILVTNVGDVRFLSASDAATLFGTPAGIGGAIVVRTAREQLTATASEVGVS